jgi:hypothetical protein
MSSKVRTLAAEYSLKALESSRLGDNDLAYGMTRAKLEKGFKDGIGCLMAIVRSEAERIENSIRNSPERMTVHERGVLEGVRWLREAIENEVQDG